MPKAFWELLADALAGLGSPRGQ